MKGTVQRYGMVIGLNADKIGEYKKLHAAVWPDVLQQITECNIGPNPPGPSLHAKLAGHAPRREVRQSVRRFALPPMVSHP